jgi:hypothetical protein
LFLPSPERGGTEGGVISNKLKSFSTNKSEKIHGIALSILEKSSSQEQKYFLKILRIIPHLNPGSAPAIARVLLL